MSFWKRLLGKQPDKPAPGAAQGKGAPTPPTAMPAATPPTPGPPLPPGDTLTSLLPELTGGAVPDAAIIARTLAELVRGGHERQAIEWRDKLAGALHEGARHGGGDAARILARDLTLEACRMRAARGELGEAVAALEALTGSPRHAASAHMLLAEHLRHQGDRRAALRHLESVLAIDVDFPNARVRAEALRRDLPDARSPDAAGETLAGDTSASTSRYQLLRQLGRGATGVVYLARDLDLDREVALKLLHPHLAAEAQAPARRAFFDEARVTAALRHPGIISVLELDEAACRLVMELAAGGTLKQRLADGPLPAAEALARHGELLAALSAAHQRGVVHRDLKPANLLFRSAGGPMLVADFGVAHFAGADRRGRERGEAVGTLAYMAPEQRRGEPAAGSADLYAAAVILWESLVGRLPWNGTTGAGERTPLVLPVGAHAGLGALVARVDEHLSALTALDPAARPSTAAALATAERLAEDARDLDEVDALAKDRDAFVAKWGAPN